MKLRAARAFLCAIAFTASLAAQTVSFFGPIYEWTPTGPGVAAGTLSLNQSGSVPAMYVVEWWTTGAAPTACTFFPEYSESSVNYYPAASAVDGSGNSTGNPIDCTTGGAVRVVDTPTLFFHLRFPTLTLPTGSQLHVRFVRGSNQ